MLIGSFHFCPFWKSTARQTSRKTYWRTSTTSPYVVELGSGARIDGDMNTLIFIETVWQDFRYAIRTMRKDLGFTIVAVLSLALGIGANTAVFSLLDALLLTKLPVRDPDGLYQIMVTHRSATHNSFSYTDYQKLHDSFDIFDGVIAWATPSFEIEIDTLPLQARGAYATGSFYEVLGVKPALGRLIIPSDDTVSGASVAVLGYSFWVR